jgi:hypothetical protein
MSTLHLHQTTTATPEQFLAALTDFGLDRSTIFPNSQDQHLQVHSRTAADVTEGTGGVWERLHYDWSDPTRIVITDTDSNVGAADPATSTRSAPGPTAAPTSTRS